MSKLKYSISPTYLYTLGRHRKETNKVQKRKENKLENILRISYKLSIIYQFEFYFIFLYNWKLFAKWYVYFELVYNGINLGHIYLIGKEVFLALLTSWHPFNTLQVK